MSNTNIKFTAPGMDNDAAAKTIKVLDQRLVALLDLQLTLKHIHWNVVGPNFIGVHEMLDPQVDAVREMTDTNCRANCYIRWRTERYTKSHC